MFSNSLFWPQNLLCRFLPSEFRQDDRDSVIIRYDTEDNSSPVDRVDEFGRFIQGPSTVEIIRPKKRRHPTDLQKENVSNVTAHDQEVVVKSRTCVPTRPITLSPRLKKLSLPQLKFNDITSTNKYNILQGKVLLSPLLNNTIDNHVNIFRSSHPIQHTVTVIVKDSGNNYRTRSKPLFSETDVSKYQERTSSKNGLKPGFCSKLSTTTNRTFRRECSHKYPPRRHSSDYGFGFLTPENKARILNVRHNWETSSTTSTHQRLSESLPRRQLFLGEYNLRRYRSDNSMNTDSFDSGYCSIKQRRYSTSETLSPLISKFQLDSPALRAQGAQADQEQTSVTSGGHSNMELPVQWQYLKEKYPVHVETISYINLKAEETTPDFTRLPIEHCRVWHHKHNVRLGFQVEFDSIIREYTVPSIKCKAGIPVQVIRPKFLPQVPTIVIYFHGGGMILGSRKETETFCKILARDACCIVVNVEYRLAPENKFPASFDDGKCVVRWVKMNLGLLGAVLESKIGVGGQSAGGQIAASVCHEITGLNFQILVYPVLDLRFGQQSVSEFEHGPVLSKEALNNAYEQFLNNEDEKYDPRASPLLQSDFTGLPPTLLLIAQIDPLRDAIYDYKQKLIEAGVPVTSYLIKGSIHGFFQLQGHFKNLCDESFKQVIEFVKNLVL